MLLDRYDAAILDALQKDGRKPIVELAEQVGLSRLILNLRLENGWE